MFLQASPRSRDSVQVQGVHGGCELQVEAGRAESFVESSKGGSKVRFVETATQSLAPAVLDLPLAPAVRVCVLCSFKWDCDMFDDGFGQSQYDSGDLFLVLCELPAR